MCLVRHNDTVFTISWQVQLCVLCEAEEKTKPAVDNLYSLEARISMSRIVATANGYPVPPVQ